MASTVVGECRWLPIHGRIEASPSSALRIHREVAKGTRSTSPGGAPPDITEADITEADITAAGIMAGLTGTRTTAFPTTAIPATSILVITLTTDTRITADSATTPEARCLRALPTMAGGTTAMLIPVMA